MPKRATSRSQGSRGTGMPRDDIQIRAFMLADHAAQEQNGKIYMNGGGIEWIGIPPDATRLPSLWLVVRLGFPWRLTSGGHSIEVNILDQDEKAIGPNPYMRGDAQIGRPPGAEPGDEFALNMVIPLAGFQATEPLPSKVIIHLRVDEREIGRLPLKLSPLVAVPGVAR
jgi:hypothetical protein